MGSDGLLDPITGLIYLLTIPCCSARPSTFVNISRKRKRFDLVMHDLTLHYGIWPAIISYIYKNRCIYKYKMASRYTSPICKYLHINKSMFRTTDWGGVSAINVDLCCCAIKMNIWINIHIDILDSGLSFYFLRSGHFGATIHRQLFYCFNLFVRIYGYVFGLA